MANKIPAPPPAQNAAGIVAINAIGKRHSATSVYQIIKNTQLLSSARSLTAPLSFMLVKALLIFIAKPKNVIGAVGNKLIRRLIMSAALCAIFSPHVSAKVLKCDKWLFIIQRLHPAVG